MANSPAPVHDELFRVAVTAIVWRESAGVRQYLITQRSPDKKFQPSKWTVPGGGVHVSDFLEREPTLKDGPPQWYKTIEQTLIREVAEEVQIKVTDVRYLTDIAMIRSDGTPLMVLSFFCKQDSGFVVLNEESVDHAWVTVEEVRGYDLIKGIADEILEADSILSGEDTTSATE